jgi:hypothetical protein
MPISAKKCHFLRHAGQRPRSQGPPGSCCRDHVMSPVNSTNHKTVGLLNVPTNSGLGSNSCLTLKIGDRALPKSARKRQKAPFFRACHFSLFCEPMASRLTEDCRSTGPLPNRMIHFTGHAEDGRFVVLSQHGACRDLPSCCSTRPAHGLTAIDSFGENAR